jgi:hypothetical protein
MSDDKKKSIICYVPYRDNEGYKLAEEFKVNASKQGYSVKIKRGRPQENHRSPGIH